MLERERARCFIIIAVFTCERVGRESKSKTQNPKDQSEGKRKRVSFLGFVSLFGRRERVDPVRPRMIVTELGKTPVIEYIYRNATEGTLSMHFWIMYEMNFIKYNFNF